MSVRIRLTRMGRKNRPYYRIGAYEEDESDALTGMGDRDGTLMAGLALTYDLPANFEAELGYEHDALDRVRGGEARFQFRRPLQVGVARVTPRVGLRWFDRDLAQYDFGVTDDQALPARPAYSPGDSLNFEVGVGTFVELTRRWRLILNLGVQFLDDGITDSPIVDEDVLYQGFFAVSWAF